MAGFFEYASESHPVWSPLAAEIHDAVWYRIGLEKVREFVRQWAIEFHQRQVEANQAAYQRSQKAKQQIEIERLRAVGQEVAEHWSDSLDISEAECLRIYWDMVLPPLGLKLPLDLELPLGLPHPEWPLPRPHRQLSEPEQWAVLAAIHDYYWPGEKISPWSREQWDQPLPTFKDENDYEQHREEAKKQFAEDAVGLDYWQLVARVDELTEHDKPVVAEWLRKVAPAAPPQPASELSTHKPAETAGRVDNEMDKKKLSTRVPRAPRGLTSAARECAKRYKAKQRKGEKPTMKSVILEYLDDNPDQKFSSIMRCLSAHPEVWKVDTKVDKAL